NKLKFTNLKDNAKLSYLNNGYGLSLSSGWSCPGAKSCKSRVFVENDKLKVVDNKDIKFRCLSPSLESRFPRLYEKNKYNFNLLKRKTEEEMFNLLVDSLPTKAKIIRLNIFGDIFNEKYYRALCRLAKEFPHILFYGYTKSVLYWISNLDLVPSNFILTASRGGRWDNLIDTYNLKNVTVVFSEQEAKDRGLEIDHDDKLAYEGTKNFALLLHGTQMAGSVAAKALSKLKGISGYSKKKNIFNKNLIDILTKE
ncbi:MAG: hypothetical protein LH629_00480, partial [Ignavibacteria bacterium]|nr:hypothetical protein [Ignavibacteria bacterium]